MGFFKHGVCISVCLLLYLLLTSSRYCIDARTQYLTETTCIEKVQSALVGYIQPGDIQEGENNLPKCLEFNAVDDQAKRRGADEDNDTNRSLCKRQKLNKRDDVRCDISSDYFDRSRGSSNDDEERSNQSADGDNADVDGREDINDDGYDDDERSNALDTEVIHQSSNDGDSNVSREERSDVLGIGLIHLSSDNDDANAKGQEHINNNSCSCNKDGSKTLNIPATRNSAREGQKATKEQREQNAIELISKKIINSWATIGKLTNKSQILKSQATPKFQFEDNEAIGARLLKLENFHWEQSCKLTGSDQDANLDTNPEMNPDAIQGANLALNPDTNRDAIQDANNDVVVADLDPVIMSWKFQFIAGCLHRLSLPTKDDTASHTARHTARHTASLVGLASSESSANPHTRRRWLFITSFVNSIVDKLWFTWGPYAVLVYEALACKYYNILFNIANFIVVCNYNMSCTRSLSNESLEIITNGVVQNIIKSVTSLPPFSSVFHPALYIGSALSASGVEYVLTIYN